MKVGVSLVLFQEPEERLVSFLSMVRSSFKPEYIVLIHENSSHPYIFPDDVMVTEYVANVGYGCAHNSNYSKLRCLGCDKVLIANTDVSFDLSVNELFTNTFYTILAPQIRNVDGTIQRVARAFPNVFWKMRSFIGEYPCYYEIQGQEVVTVPSISGCFFVVDVRLYEKKKFGFLFDPNFFMYEEDTDLCRRLWTTKGVGLNPKVDVYHGYAKGSSRIFRLFILHMRSLMKYFLKWGFFDSASTESKKYMLKIK